MDKPDPNVEHVEMKIVDKMVRVNPRGSPPGSVAAWLEMVDQLMGSGKTLHILDSIIGVDRSVYDPLADVREVKVRVVAPPQLPAPKEKT